MPKLSVITINYNNVNGLRKTIDSIIRQSCRDYEWIVIDGGSDDGSRQLVEQHRHHMSYWVSEPDTGIYNAMNKGIEHASGDYIQFLNSGDYYYDNGVIVDFIRTGHTADVVYGRAMIVDDAGNGIREWRLPDGPLRLSFFWSHNLNHQASFFARRCFDGRRFNESHRINSDQEMFMTLAYGGYSFAFFDRLVVKYDNMGISSTIAETGSEFADTVCRVLPPALREDYREMIQYRDVDLHLMVRDIVASNRAMRAIARVMLHPIHFIAKRLR